MREIKFRVWYKKFNTWDTITTIEGDFNKVFEIENFIFQQYTGVKDKNGKDVYEGDILRTLNYDAEKNEDIHMYSEVYYNLDSAQYLQKFKDLKDHYPILSTNIFSEVVGNIFENPELLK